MGRGRARGGRGPGGGGAGRGRARGGRGPGLTRPSVLPRRRAGARRHRGHRHRRPAGHLRGAGPRGRRAEKVFRLLKPIKGLRPGPARLGCTAGRARVSSVSARECVASGGGRQQTTTRDTCAFVHLARRSARRSRVCVRGAKGAGCGAGCGQRSGHDTRAGTGPETSSPGAVGPTLLFGPQLRPGRPRGWEGPVEPAPDPPPFFWRSGLERAGVRRPSELWAKGYFWGLGPHLRARAPLPFPGVPGVPSTLGSSSSRRSQGGKPRHCRPGPGPPPAAPDGSPGLVGVELQVTSCK